jgi:hypothetical protein
MTNLRRSPEVGQAVLACPPGQEMGQRIFPDQPKLSSGIRSSETHPDQELPGNQTEPPLRTNKFSHG